MVIRVYNPLAVALAPLLQPWGNYDNAFAMILAIFNRKEIYNENS